MRMHIYTYTCIKHSDSNILSGVATIYACMLKQTHNFPKKKNQTNKKKKQTNNEFIEKAQSVA